MSLPSSLLSAEGWISVSVCFIVYNVSVVSMGQKSIAHNWLFTGLSVFSPTNESVSKLSAKPLANKRKQKLQIQNIEARLAALELQSTTVQPGMLTMTSLESSDGIKLWTNLDNACVCAICCVFSLGLCFCIGWVRVLSNPCCSDMSCWMEWWTRKQNAVPLLSLLALMSFHSAWTLGKLSSRLQDLTLPYSPSSIVGGIACAGIALLVINTPCVLERMDTPATLALEEGAARILLWLRLVGMRISSEDLSLQRIIHIGRLSFAALFGSLGFVVWDPLQGTCQLMVYRWQDLASRPERRWSWYQSVGGIPSLFLLSLLILLTYLVPNRGDVPRLYVRTMAAWLHVWIMCSLAKELLQTYMNQTIPQVAAILSESSPPESDRIMYPFRSRFQRLVRTGSQLVTFPFCVVALLTIGHLCHVHGDMYPIPYGGSTLDKSSLSTLKA